MNNETNRTDIHEISPEALAVLGGGKLAYVKTIRSEDVQKHFPQAPELPLRVAALCAARRRRHADHAHRQPRGGGRECLEQRARDGERALGPGDAAAGQSAPASGIRRLSVNAHGSGWRRPVLD